MKNAMNVSWIAFITNDQRKLDEKADFEILLKSISEVVRDRNLEGILSITVLRAVPEIRLLEFNKD